MTQERREDSGGVELGAVGVGKFGPTPVGPQEGPTLATRYMR